MKRPPARERSPPHISLTSAPPIKPPPPPPSAAEQKGAKSQLKPPEVPKVRSVRKREIVRRSVRLEIDAYGRSFTGCGLHADYDLITKLGEGTFGYVWLIA